ncbi:MAG: hypothetical protein DVB25_08880 [Verrucomicrobia bacterium]|nr:MAG: hypothetical protein DVB25_08880 [Verrucomicrobiota bacterium]
MNLNPDLEETARLEALAQQAQQYALHMMHSTGSVPLTVIADTVDGFIFGMPSGMPDEAAKDRVAEVTRLLAIAHGARAIMIVAEAWVRMAVPGKQLDTNSPPSQSPERQEVVVLMLEGQTRSATGLLPILREGSGEFREFGQIPALNFTSTSGRFTGLMPKHPHSAQVVAAAKAALLAMGMQVVNRGFDPSQN